MDALDSMILERLEKCGFQKPNELAPVVGIGPDAVRRRVARMIRTGIVKIIAVPNAVELGFAAWADVGIHVVSGHLDDVARKLARHPAVYYVAKGFGEFDIYASAIFPTSDELATFSNSDLAGMAGVAQSEIMLVLSPRKYYRHLWPAQPPSGVRTLRPDAPASEAASGHPDEMDRAIIRLLVRDGTTRPARLHTLLGYGEDTIRRRIKAMINRGQISLEAVFNPDVVRHRVSAMIGVRVNGEDANRVADAVVDNPAVHSVFLMLGRFNLVLGARFDGIDQLARYCGSELPLVPGVRAVHPFIVHRPLRYYGIDWTASSDKPDGSLGGWIADATIGDDSSTDGSGVDDERMPEGGPDMEGAGGGYR